MLKRFLMATASAAAISLGATSMAYAAGSGGAGASETQQRQQGTMGSPSQPGAQGQMGQQSQPYGAQQDSLAARDLEGKDIKNPEGETIGEVKEVVGNNVIVGVGGFLGLGEREVAIPRDRLQVSGTGDDAEIITSMTREQLEALPEHDSGASGAGSAPARGSTGTTGGNY